MATVTTKKSEVTYVLELSQREAEALIESLFAVDFDKGEGKIVEGIHDALQDAGVDDWACESEITEDWVIVTRRNEGDDE